MHAAVSAAAKTSASTTFLKKAIASVKAELLKAIADAESDSVAALMRDLDALTNWKDTIDERMASLELDMRSDDEHLMSMIQERKSLAASGDAGSFAITGYTLQNEEGVLAFIQPLPHKPNYSVFTNMKILLSLCGDDITSLETNMLLHKAAKGADFEDTFTARVNTAHVVIFPLVFGHTATTGDSTKMVWNYGFKLHTAYAGGLKSGGKTTTES